MLPLVESKKTMKKSFLKSIIALTVSLEEKRIIAGPDGQMRGFVEAPEYYKEGEEMPAILKL